MGRITRPIVIDKGEWICQKAGRSFLLYDGKTGDHIRDFNGFDKMYDYIEAERMKRAQSEKSIRDIEKHII